MSIYEKIKGAHFYDKVGTLEEGPCRVAAVDVDGALVEYLDPDPHCPGEFVVAYTKIYTPAKLTQIAFNSMPSLEKWNAG